jgi:hypothetical protein
MVKFNTSFTKITFPINKPDAMVAVGCRK